MEIIRDGVVIAKLTRDSEHHTGYDTMSRSMMLQCNVGSRLWVAAESQTGLWNNPAMPTSFSGFFMYPVIE